MKNSRPIMMRRQNTPKSMRAQQKNTDWDWLMASIMRLQAQRFRTKLRKNQSFQAYCSGSNIRPMSQMKEIKIMRQPKKTPVVFSLRSSNMILKKLVRTCWQNTCNLFYLSLYYQ
ncbi:hypothetical protein FGO68_gene13457 [Halteria grandinella]|uniref:Uncharacterized protein n=1 Tax=Halteria grandinella TaxID=5974 RepID=A0A8J8SWD9_HALGN|nr:hypothetical protein FGO68_gene13457 [Halteria grandinella]